MNKTIFGLMAAFLFVATLAVASVGMIGNAIAGTGMGCPTSYSRSACAVWLRQQTAPALNGPVVAAREPMRCVAVLQNEASALALRKGKGNKGPVITSWRKATLSWQETDRGYETTVCFPVRYAHEYAEMTLCGARGHSSWGRSLVSYLKRANVGSSDPACTGDTGWCGKRGL